MQVTNVSVGNCYWSAWGNKGWSAVKVLSISGDTAEAQRVKPKTGEIIRTSKVKLDRLAPRNPALKGSDMPSTTPNEFFKNPVGTTDAKPAIAKKLRRANINNEDDGSFTEEDDEEAGRSPSRFGHLMDLLKDD